MGQRESVKMAHAGWNEAKRELKDVTWLGEEGEHPSFFFKVTHQPQSSRGIPADP